MANLVISGDTSGSVTLSAPAVSGTTVLTLPTTSGTLVTTGGGSTVQFAAGSAAAPSITFTGDTNTGIFSPAADTIAFTEGGVESMRIDSSGNLGIGTSSPSHKITLGGQTGATATPLALRFSNDFSNTATAASSKIFLYNDGTAGNTFGIGVGQSGDIQYHAGSSGGAGNGNHRFYTNDSERMRIDSSGNVGIGVTPSAWTTSFGFKALDIGQGCVLGATSDANLIFNGFFNASNNWIYKTTAEAARYQQSGSSHIWYGAASGTAGNTISFTERMRIDSAGNVGIGTSSPSTKLAVAGGYISQATGGIVTFLGADGTGSLVGTTTNHYFRFITNDTERMRLDTAGTLFIGATSSPSGVQRLVLTADGNAGTEPLLINELRAGTSTENAIRFYRNGSQVGTIQNTGTATIYNTSSDYRLKENVQPMTGALAKVAQLKPCTYKWKLNGLDGQGFIAHELQEVVPDCVSGEKDGEQMQGIDTSFLVATLTAAIQEQQAIITDLKTRIELLEGTK